MALTPAGRTLARGVRLAASEIAAGIAEARGDEARTATAAESSRADGLAARITELEAQLVTRESERDAAGQRGAQLDAELSLALRHVGLRLVPLQARGFARLQAARGQGRIQPRLAVHPAGFEVAPAAVVRDQQRGVGGAGDFFTTPGGVVQAAAVQHRHAVGLDQAQRAG